jgi:hypothetical protein
MGNLTKCGLFKYTKKYTDLICQLCGSPRGLNQSCIRKVLKKCIKKYIFDINGYH